MVALKPLILSIKDSIVDNKTSLISAGVAFYVFLSIFPALASILSIYGLVADPKDVERYIEMFSGVIPGGTVGMLSKF